MVSRCTKPDFPKYEFYGGRGVAVHPSWLSFNSFYADMGDRPVGKTLDRIDSLGNYEPGNCRWADRETQANNTRSCRRLTFDGQTLTLAQWSRKVGIRWTTLSGRLGTGWPVELALTAKPSRRQKYFPAASQAAA
jgi:hypothetical protein